MLDLHMHSRMSDDGEFSPAELVEKCRSAGIGFLSITDHNTLAAFPEAREAARRLGVGYVSGVELDCVYEGCEFHLLGYGVRDRSGEFARMEAGLRDQCRAVSREMLDKTRAFGFDVTAGEMERVSRNCSWEDRWTGEMFGEVILNRPDYAGHPLLRPYRPGGPRSDNPYVNFYWDFYAQGRPCHVPMMYPGMAELVERIHGDGGRAVLAHPGANLKGREALLEGIFDLGVDGVEAFSSYHTPEQAADYARRGRERGRFLSCGSDFHGRLKPAITLGRMTFPPQEDRAAIEAALMDALESLAE